MKTYSKDCLEGKYKCIKDFVVPCVIVMVLLLQTKLCR